jgi:Helix-hairpin-helix motif
MIVTPVLAALGDSARSAFLAAMLAVVAGVLIAWLATSATRRRRRHHRPAVPALPGVPAVRSRLPEPFGPMPPRPAEPSQLTPYVNGAETVKAPPVLDPDAIHLNSASYEELRQIEGIDPLRAAQILAYRRQHGQFATQDDLQRETGLELDGLEGTGGRRVLL